MSDHLPECWCRPCYCLQVDQPSCRECICDNLRACEQRVRQERTENGTSVTHDPLCLIPKIGGFYNMGGALFAPALDGECDMCNFIADIRKDERTNSTYQLVRES